MWTLLLLILLVMSVGTLFVPADLSFEIERTQTFNIKLGFRWLFIRVPRKVATRRRKTKTKPDEGWRRPPVPLRTLTAACRVPGLWRSARRFAARIARSVRVLQITAKVRMGTGDPADTGRLWALIGPLNLWFNRWAWLDFGVEPEFSSACLTGRLEGTVRLYPARLAYGIGATVFSLTTARVVRAVIGSQPWKR